MTAACDNATVGEVANSITHGVGVILSAAGLAAIVAAAASTGIASLVVACAVYGTSLVLLYLSSTLYHALTNRRAKRVFRILDDVSIYLLIAGTYTVHARNPIGVWRVGRCFRLCGRLP